LQSRVLTRFMIAGLKVSEFEKHTWKYTSVYFVPDV